MAYSYSAYANAFGQVPACGQADLAHILALADHEPLFARLRAYNRTGRPPYPVEAMWRAGLSRRLPRISEEAIGSLRQVHLVNPAKTGIRRNVAVSGQLAATGQTVWDWYQSMISDPVAAQTAPDPVM